MAQKSLPTLSKINTSMVWYTTYYYKHYKWLSSQNLYLLYFFNKLFVYLDFICLNLLWVSFYNSQLYSYRKTAKLPIFSKQRFFKPVTSYLVSLNSKSIFFNVYYKTTLEKFQSLNNVEETFTYNFFTRLSDTSKLTRLGFFK